MPRKVTLTWAKVHSRWRKVYKGRQWHSRVCSKSDVEAYRLAVAECEKWKATVDEEESAKVELQKAAILSAELRSRIALQAEKLRSVADLWDRRGMLDRAAAVRAGIAELKRNPALLTSYEEKPAIPIEPFAVERIANQLNAKTIEKSKVLSQCVSDFLAHKASVRDEGKITGVTYDNLDRQVRVFLEWQGDTSTDSISADTLPTFRQFLLRQYKRHAAKDVFIGTKQFLKWCYERDRLEQLPRNFRSRDFDFATNYEGEIVVWSKEQWQQAVNKASERLRLYLLLMLNCGMYQGDLSSLRDREVDWESGRIVRRRTKTQKHDGVPVVEFPLWPETFRLLMKHRSGDEFVLLTSTGKQIVRNYIGDDGRNKRDDTVHRDWYRWCAAAKVRFPPLKCLRKTGATELAEEYGYNFAILYLGHAPRSIADKHYIRPPKMKFDEAIGWLGKKFPLPEETQHRWECKRSVPDPVPEKSQS